MPPSPAQVSRALGDYAYKQVTHFSQEKQQVSCEPETTVLKREDRDDYLILACDGIWDVMTNEDCVEFVRSKVRAGETDLGVVSCTVRAAGVGVERGVCGVLCSRAGFLGERVPQVCEMVCDHCLGLNSRDNMTCLIVQLPGAVEPSAYVHTCLRSCGSQDCKVPRLELRVADEVVNVALPHCRDTVAKYQKEKLARAAKEEGESKA